MKKIIIFLFCLISIHAIAQDLMRINKHDGSFIEFSINNITDMDFHGQRQINIVGDWFFPLEEDGWEDGICCISFNANGNFTLLSYNRELLYDAKIYEHKDDGTYTIANNIVTLNFSDGVVSRIDIVQFSDYHFVSSAEEVFYKVRDYSYKMTTEDEPISIGGEGDIIKYADNCFCEIEDNKIRAITDGIGYVLVEDAQTKELKAFKVEIEYVAPPFIIWTDYFKKPLAYILDEFGTPDRQEDSQHSKTFTYYNADILSVSFIFSENWDKVKQVDVSFYDQEKRQPYCDYITEKYVSLGTLGGVQLFGETNDTDNTVLIYVNTANDIYQIIYKDISEE